MKIKLKRGILLVLLSWDGQPMQEATLVSAVQTHARPAQPTEDDVRDALKDLSAEGYVFGATDDFTQEHTWTLTTSGVHQARKMRP
jgi:hypothetical protein